VILVDAQHAGALLMELRTTGRTIPELPDGLRPESWEEAYAVQDALHVAAGWDIAVLKVGCTSVRAQEALGIAEPIGGRVPAAALFDSGPALRQADFHHVPLLECEFAFRVANDVAPDDTVTGLAAIRELVDVVAPAVEVVDSRYDKIFAASGPSIVADNSAAAAVVLGEPVDVASAGDLATCDVELTAGAERLAQGTGAAVLGNPLLALEWVVAHERSRERSIAGGTWVITGTCTGMTPCPVDQPVTARFEGLGDVSVTFVQ
jgi:2-keto-4-pentenoate hydratase